MDFNELFKLVVPTDNGILDLVDEYTLYCHYTGIDNLVLGRAYNAPYRQDDCPSFTVYASNKPDRQYMWKDHATNEAGDIFKFIVITHGLSGTAEALDLISADFGLGFNTDSQVKGEKIVWFDKPQSNDIKIRVSDRPMTIAGRKFWEQFRVGQDLLDFYYTTQVEYYWTYNQQTAPYQAADPTFAYRTGAYYQLYSPYAEKKYKFRNDLPEDYFFGYLQLPKTGPKLILDKSCKDVIFCRKLGYPATCGKSETTFIPHHKMLELHERFPDMYLMLDDDPAGRKMTEKYVKLYPFLKPRFLWVAKDKTDACLKVGFEQTERLVCELLD